MIFEAAADQGLSRLPAGRGQRVAGEARIVPPSKRERAALGCGRCALPIGEPVGRSCRRSRAAAASRQSLELMSAQCRASTHEPAAASGRVMPVSRCRPARIVTHIDIVDTRPMVRRAGAGRATAASPRIGELVLVRARTQTRDRLCACLDLQLSAGWVGRPTPFSSISAPRAKRSSRKRAAVGCGSLCAIRCAKHQPDAGVALKPP